MNKKLILGGAIGFWVFLLAFSCIRKEKYDKVVLEPWEPSFAFPLINATLSLKDVAENIDKSTVSVEERGNGLYVFIYRDTLVSENAENLIMLPDQHFSNTFNLSTAESVSLASGITVNKSFQETVDFETENQQELKYVDLKDGNLSLNFSSQFLHNIELTITIPSLQKNGVVFSKTYDLNYTSYTPVTVTDNINLNGYRVNLSGTGVSTNKLDYVIDAKIVSTGQPVTGTETLQGSLSFSRLKYKLLFGNLGFYEFPEYAGTVGIEIFKNAQQGEVIFNDPILKMTTLNSFGVPSSFKINKFETETDYGIITAINPYSTLYVPGPNTINTPSQPGANAVTDFRISKSNSNIVEAFKPAPSKLNYNIVPIIGSQGETNNFLLDTSNIKIFAEAEIPMDGSIKIYTMNDTVPDIDLPEDDYINYVTFKIKTTNSLPLDVNLQGYWLDSLGNKVDTLFKPAKEFIVSGRINSNGEVIAPSQQYIEVTYDAARYQKMKHANKLMIEGNLASSNNGSTPVKFFSFNQLQFQMSVFFKAKVEF